VGDDLECDVSGWEEVAWGDWRGLPSRPGTRSAASLLR
jgi:hypothetical protein